MESNFFNYLLKHLRDQQISAHYSMPVKASYPGCELDHKETQVFSGKEVLAFNVIVYFDVLSQQSILDYVQKVEGILETTSHVLEGGKYIARIRVNSKKQPPHERGKLRQTILECVALIIRGENHG